MRLFRRLRTQLIVSHLIAIACTLVALAVAFVLIAGSWFASQRGSLNEPAQQAQSIAQATSELITPGAISPDLNAVLRALANGQLRLSGWPAYAPWTEPRGPAQGATLHDVAYIAVVDPEGKVLASSDPAGAAFSPPERGEWDALVRAALAGTRLDRELVELRPNSQPAALGAYPVPGQSGRPRAVVIVASRIAPPTSAGMDWIHSLILAGAASAALLAGASVFALISAGLVGYLLSRRLVSRLERLGHAAEALADGDLSQRVDEGPADEVGQLARRFNAMAERLARMVDELTVARDRTEATLKAKRALVANVSHELRTPLALIRGYVESLALTATDGDPVRRRDYLAVVERETENLSRLIDDLFTLSTAEAGALPLTLGPVALSEVVQQMADSLGPIARRERQIAVVASLPEDLPPVWADQQRVVQILGNLVRNALRHTPEGGLVALRAVRQDGWVTVSVEDTGEGIPPERIPYLFDRFYRGDEARDRASGGAGLGLAIVRELVEAMGGDVSVESTVGQGSRFSFRLPLATEAMAVPAAATSPPMR